ncbi:hypothetical protein [Microlunatus speluncae]|uniref:hypothetical protein n=1 Tax=Microlunatus speluncae TaxID=2594267 RepID=UPI0012664AA1|nr:hypothetical protein [Microlunatus speluncae]
MTITVAGATTAAVLLLAGCAAAQGQTGTGQPAGQPSSPAAAPSTPAGDASTPSGTGPSESGPSDDSERDAGGKPTKEEIVTGLTKFYQEKHNQPADKAKNFAVCMVDEMYDKAKPASLRAMRDGDPTKLDKSDAALLSDSAYKCMKHIS